LSPTIASSRPLATSVTAKVISPCSSSAQAAGRLETKPCPCPVSYGTGTGTQRAKVASWQAAVISGTSESCGRRRSSRSSKSVSGAGTVTPLSNRGTAGRVEALWAWF
jgi:hypothetical protein